MAGTQDDNPDTDGDGYSDGLEVSEGSNPLSVYSQPNRSPVDLELDPKIVEENLAVGTIVTQLVPVDPDDPQVLDDYTYQFIQGAGERIIICSALNRMEACVLLHSGL